MTVRTCVRPLLGVLLAASAFLAQAGEPPQLVHHDGRFALMVDGRPFTVLAAQLNNSSAWPDVLPEVWPAVEAVHANTVEAPVYWEQFEPRPGQFDYTNIDALVTQARAHHVHLILLWFGTWKNGQMHYVPTWIKDDPTHYPRMLDADGQPIEVLSPYSAANLQADRTAFVALMKHLRAIDGDRHTVIMVQVENEPGAIGTVRDHGAAADRAFAGPVPTTLAQALHKPAGSWRQLFGADAAEAFAAYGIADYIQQVAAAGKAVYPLPMYVNTWLRYKGKHLPGIDYPSGGATWNVLDIWKATVTSIDLIGTDLYTDDYHEFTRVVGQYHRPDNPSWISETGFEAGTAKFLFYILGKGGIGFSTFGVDGHDTDAAGKAASQAYARNYGAIGAIDRIVASAAYEGRLQAVVEQRGQPKRVLRFGHWRIDVSFGAPAWGDAPPILAGNPHDNGHVLVIQLDPHTFLVTGFHARVEFKRTAQDGRRGQLLRVEEGDFEHDGRWHSRRWLNGDQTDYGLNFGDDSRLLRVTVGSY
ncbi:DUF5597 domain-containing protein [Dyella sp. A6]|uniref:DUF5597 domain-containing protein n=1 Tax=Dyella aluminiiresistens TaxID=3069105 RepID=UPI002E78B5BE|nr:DUF5597 domain-containing protein [Dyella sp. A6]